MGGDEGKQLMFFQGLMQRPGSISTHAYSSLPGFPPQVHLPMMPGACPPPPPLGPGAFTCAGPGYAFAQANAFAYPPPPPPPLAGTYAYPPQGYPHPGLPSLPYQGHGISCHGGGRQMEGIMESKPKAGGTAATASATAGYGEIGHGSGGGHGGNKRQVEVMETTTPPKKAGGAAAATASIYGALDKLSRGHGGRNGPFGFFGNCCGGHRTTSFQHADDDYYGHQGKFKGGHRPSKVEHVHGRFHAKSTTWKY